MRIYLSCLLVLTSIALFGQLSFSDESSTLFYQSTNSGAPMGVADMNGDGLDDIIRLDGTTTPVFDYQDASGNFTGLTFPQLNGTQWSMSIADADKNGYNDVFTGGAYNTLKLLKANATGDNFTLTIISNLSIFLQGSNFADIDNDGDVDIFACHDDGLSHVYENTGNGNYAYNPTLINTASTVPSNNSGNYGTLWTDYDNDGDLDLYISKCRLGVDNPNDGRRLNLLFENDGNGNYTDVAEEVGLLPHGQSWAADFADIDNDGDLDCFVINHDISCNLYINDGTGHFADSIATSGMLAALNAAGGGIQCKFVDFDNDGFVDLLFSSRANNHLLFKNDGDRTFTNVTGSIPAGGDRIHSFATGDLNNDGFIDFIAGFANGYNTPSNINDKLYMNEGNNNHYFNVRLEGDTSNLNGVGARLELYGSWGKQIREIRAGESYGISTSLTAHFGIGSATSIDSLIIRWPSGYIDKADEVTIDETIIVAEGSNCVAMADFDHANTDLDFEFTDASSLGTTSWFWTFGDGASSTTQNPSHSYAQDGTYLVCLFINGDCGQDQICKQIMTNCVAPTADFIFNTNALTANFTSIITGTATSLTWNFGDGNSISGIGNPSHTYALPDTYTVCLEVGSDCGNTEICHDVTVNCNPPGVGFQAQSTNLTIAFTDNSDADVTAWLWNFGDGTTSTLENPTHTYASPGTYTICLTGTSACGASQVCLPITVNCALPSIGFNAQISSLTIAFTDNSGADVTAWLWNFGDGTSSTVENPTHTFPSAGTYTVCLTGTSACGSNQVCLPITVNCALPGVGFQTQTASLTTIFTDNSSPDVTAWLWNFGDGTSSTTENPTHSFASPGTYTVCLTGTSACGSNQVCLPITVNCAAPAPGFQTQVNQNTVTLTDNSSTDATEWFWSFGDGSTSTEQNPTHTYTTSGSYTICLTVTSVCGSSQVCLGVTIDCIAPTSAFDFQIDELTVSFVDNSSSSVLTWFWTFGDGDSSTQENPTHEYTTGNLYTVCLTVTNECGNEQICQEVAVNCPAPQALFNTLVNNYTTTFTDTSINDPSSWSWNFGDGTTSSLQNPIHTYTQAGTYTACLTAQSACGENSYCLPIVIVCDISAAAFSYQNNNLTTNFTDNSTNEPTAWLWNFGDGQTSSLQNPVHTYATPGAYMICLTASNICGNTQSCQQVAITCDEPETDFSFQHNDLVINFTDNSTNQPTAWVWTFGDGGSSTAQNPTHTFSEPGTYTVCLTASSVCGNNQTCQSVTTNCMSPVASFGFQSNELSVSFSDNSTNQPTEWLWTFGDGETSTAQNPTYIYATPGNYMVCLTTTSICGTDQVCQQISTNCTPPSVGFSVQITALAVMFSDNSAAETTQWSWDFGDGNSSTAQNPNHSFTLPGTYTVCLTATSICGSAQACTPITVSCAPPTVGFSIQADELILNFTDDSATEIAEWSWTFGDGETSTAQNPTHSYVTPGDYTICLEGTSLCGTSQICQTVAVNCAAPSVDFETIMMLLTVDFTDNSADEVDEWLWTFGDGTTAMVQNPSHIYANDGTYMVCLIGTSICGSTEICQEITVSCTATVAMFNAETTELTVSFTDNSTNQPSEWLWDFGEGSTATVQHPTHEYSTVGIYTICLTVTNDCGTSQTCQEVTVNCVEPQAGFEIDITNLTVILNDISTNMPVQWMWNFGDGGTSTIQHPIHQYSEAGQYTICLSVMNVCGFTQICETVTVSCVEPEALFSVNGNSLIQSFTDASTNTPTQWLWNFGDGQTATEQSPNHAYQDGGTYNVCLSVTNDCGTNTSCQLILLTTSTNDIALDIAINLFPNPANLEIKLTVNSNTVLDTEVMILNAHGQRMNEKEKWQVTPMGDPLFLDIQNLPAGIYFVVVLTNEGQLVKRFLKL